MFMYMYIYIYIYMYIYTYMCNVVCRTGRPYLVTVHVKKKKRNVSGKL